MKILVSALVALAALSSSAQIQSTALDATMKMKIQQEIDYVGTLYGSVYAPKAWKEKHNGWDLTAQITLAQTKLAAAKSLYEARQAMADLINSTQDYHVSFSYYTTEKASLPFQVKTVQGKSLIVYIDRTKLSPAAFPYNEGDELLTIDQMPVAQLKSAIVSKMGANIAETDSAIADIYVTRRSAKNNSIVPHGPVTLSVKSAVDDSVSMVTLTWDYTPEQLAQKRSFPMARPSNPLFEKPMIGSKISDLIESPMSDNPYSIGVRGSFLPDLGSRIWESSADSEFDAYIYKNAESKLVGVLRIASYVPSDSAKAVKDFSQIIAHFEKNVDAMVIDQNNNPGGSVFYLYTLASMLSDNALTVPKHSIALTQPEASECITTLKSLENVTNDEEAAKVLKGWLDGYPETYQAALGIRDYCNFMINEFQAGNQFSSPYYLWGLDKITPNKVHFTKPILLLINELDFSGGDFFPAIMQDNKRVTTLGVRTSGAGGYVNEASFPNNIGLEKIRFTGSIAERVNSNPIENLGVTPDIKVSMTVDDVRNNYKNYLDEVRTALKTLMK